MSALFADIAPWSLAFACAMALLAGLIDAMVGGGGMIQVPALFNALPGMPPATYPEGWALRVPAGSALAACAALVDGATDAAWRLDPVHLHVGRDHLVLGGMPPATVFGTNKFSAIAGTATASLRYARSIRIDWRIAAPASLAALLCAFVGARMVAWLPVALARPLVLVLLVLMALYTMRQKQLGAEHQPLADIWQIRRRALLMGAAIGFYDGFFGPGTGSFLLFACVRWFGCDFLRASAIAKIVNLATNLAALAYFIPSGNVLYLFAVPMALLMRSTSQSIGTTEREHDGVAPVAVAAPADPTLAWLSQWVPVER